MVSRLAFHNIFIIFKVYNRILLAQRSVSFSILCIMSITVYYEIKLEKTCKNVWSFSFTQNKKLKIIQKKVFFYKYDPK